MSKIDLDWIQMIEGESGKIRDQDLYLKLNRWASSSDFHHLLDLGCGQGICSQKIDLALGHYTGIDSSEILVERATQLYTTPKIKFLLGDALDLPFEDDSFDAVICISLIHLIEDLEEFFFELSRVLKPKGRFFIVTASPSSYEAWEEAYKDKVIEGSKLTGKRVVFDGSEVEETLFLHEGEEIYHGMLEAGLEIEDIEPFRNFIAIRGYSKNK